MKVFIILWMYCIYKREKKNAATKVNSVFIIGCCVDDAACFFFLAISKNYNHDQTQTIRITVESNYLVNEFEQNKNIQRIFSLIDVPQVFFRFT